MTRRRFYAPPSAFNKNAANAELAADEARHLREVLRLKVGDEIYVFNGEGQEFQCRIEEIRRDSAKLSVIKEVEPARPESALNLTLGVALLKADKFDLVVQKATELGVSRIMPVVTKLADIRLRDDSDTMKRVTRWQRIALEAAKQCGRAVVPEITAPVTFESLVNETMETMEMREATEANAEPHLSLLFSERDGSPLSEALQSRGELSQITALVGSEGGWTDPELERARQNGWKIITLGGRTLRAETAAIVISALLQHAAGDLV